MNFNKIIFILTILLLTGSGCAKDRVISEIPFESIKFSDKWITITAEPNYNIEDSYNKNLLPEKITKVNLTNLENLYGTPDNSYSNKKKKEIIHEFYLDKGKYKLTNYDIQDENAIYKKAGYALEYFPNNLKFSEFFDEKISKYIKECQKNNDEVILMLYNYGDKSVKDVEMLVVVKGENIESMVF